MSGETAIEWTDLTWNPVHGCSKVSPGCAHCYAETLSRRYKQTPAPWTPANAAENVILKPHKLREPLSNAKHWRGLGAAAAAAGKTEGKLVFVNSMSDLFHEQVPDSFIAEVFATMLLARRHTFQILTKRPERMRDYLAGPNFLLELWAAVDARSESLPFDMHDDVPALPNVWLGVSIENRRFVHRADLLRETPAAVRFISAEPLLGPLFGGQVERATEGVGKDSAVAGSSARSTFGTGATIGTPEPARLPGYTPKRGALDLTAIDWLIVGGESGARARPMRAEWARDLRDAATSQGRWHGRPGRTAFFFKQWGGRTPKAGGRELDGREWSEFPLSSERGGTAGDLESSRPLLEGHSPRSLDSAGEGL